MTAPNVVNVTSISGKTNVANVSTTATDIVNNAASSSQLYKINSLVVSNIDGTASANIYASVFRNSIEYKLLHTVVIPAGASLVAVAKDTGIYLEEGDGLRLTASANSKLQAVCSYEIIS